MSRPGLLPRQTPFPFHCRGLGGAEATVAQFQSSLSAGQVKNLLEPLHISSKPEIDSLALVLLELKFPWNHQRAHVQKVHVGFGLPRVTLIKSLAMISMILSSVVWHCSFFLKLSRDKLLSWDAAWAVACGVF